jgi:hypothetical protein
MNPNVAIACSAASLNVIPETKFSLLTTTSWLFSISLQLLGGTPWSFHAYTPTLRSMWEVMNFQPQCEALSRSLIAQLELSRIRD